MKRRNLKRKNGVLAVTLTTGFCLDKEFCGNETTSPKRVTQTSLYRDWQ